MVVFRTQQSCSVDRGENHRECVCFVCICNLIGLSQSIIPAAGGFDDIVKKKQTTRTGFVRDY